MFVCLFCFVVFCLVGPKPPREFNLMWLLSLIFLKAVVIYHWFFSVVTGLLFLLCLLLSGCLLFVCLFGFCKCGDDTFLPVFTNSH